MTSPATRSASSDESDTSAAYDLFGCQQRLQAIEAQTSALLTEQQQWYASTVADCCRKQRIAVESAVADRMNELKQTETLNREHAQTAVDDLRSQFENDRSQLQRCELQVAELQASLVSSRLQCKQQADANIHSEQALCDLNASNASLQEQVSVLKQEASLLGEQAAAQQLANREQAALEKHLTSTAERLREECKRAEKRSSSLEQKVAALQTSSTCTLELNQTLGDAANKALVWAAASGSDLLERMRKLLMQTSKSMATAPALRLKQGLDGCKADCDMWYSALLAAAHHARIGEVDQLLGATAIYKSPRPVQEHQALSLPAANSSLGAFANHSNPLHMRSGADIEADDGRLSPVKSMMSGPSSMDLLRHVLQNSAQEQRVWSDSSSIASAEGQKSTPKTQAVSSMVGESEAEDSLFFLRRLDEYLSHTAPVSSK
jgi:hypothetical protein